MSKPPAVQFYAGDFLTGTTLMTNEEVGLYIRLLCLQAENGSVPDDPERMALVYGPQVPKLWPAVRSKFVKGKEAGTMVNVKMEKVLEDRAEFRRRQSEKGKASAQARANHGSENSEPRFNPGSTPVEPLGGRGRGRGRDKGEGEGEGEAKKERAHKAEIIPKGMSVELYEAVKRWEQYRTEKRNKLTPSGREAFIKKVLKMGEERAVSAIDHSIEQGWTGMYEPKNEMKQHGQITEDDYQKKRRMVAEAQAKHYRERDAANGN